MKFALSRRHKRLLVIVSTRSRRRAIFLLGGVVVGAAAAVLAQLADLAQSAFALLLGQSRYWPLLVTPLGFLISVYLTNRFFQNAQGSGIPQAIAARRLTDQGARGRLVSLRVAAGKIRADAVRPLGRRLGRARGADRADRRLDHVRARALVAAAAAGADPRRRLGRGRGGVQHAARRHRLRHRGNEPLVRDAVEHADHRRGGRGRPDLDRAARQLHLFRHQRDGAARRPRLAGDPGLRRRGRARRRIVQPRRGGGGRVGADQPASAAAGARLRIGGRDLRHSFPAIRSTAPAMRR